MIVDLDHHGGGILIEGTDAELLSLADDLSVAADIGIVETSLVTEDGVVRMLLRRDGHETPHA